MTHVCQGALTRNFGGVVAEFEGIADVGVTRPFLERWMSEVRERQREMDKM